MMIGPSLETASVTLASLLPVLEFNTRVALLGAGSLGAAAGFVGTFLVLRRRALIADTLGHSTLPGVCIAFLLMTLFLGSARNLPLLLAGGTLSAGLAAWAVSAVARLPKIREDAALAIVLGAFFGLGIALLGVLQQLETGQVAGLDALIDGNVASLRAGDAEMIAWLSLGAVLVTILLFKELALLAFDAEQARLQGLPIRFLEFVQLVLTVVVTVAGLRAVGLILIIALLVIPPAAARFWSNRLPVVAALSALIGGLSGLMGAWISAQRAGLPTGPLIVLTASAVFALSLIFGTTRRRRRVERVPGVDGSEVVSG
ncbi:MAG: iron chelate uptake ABC transporter family permease subunit [Planctomycetota bacterium]